MLRLLLVILLSWHSVVGPFGLFREVCRWSDFTIPSHELGLAGFHRQNVFFTPARSSRRIQVMLEDGTVMDPHYEISSHQFIIREVTERDEGQFSFTLSDRFLILKIKDCPKETKYGPKGKQYGTDYFFSVPPNAYHLEFTPLKSTNEPPVLLWNRDSNSEGGGGGGGGRGRLGDNNDKWIMEKLSQEHSGYYTFRDRRYSVITTNKMTVEEQKHDFLDKVKGEDLQIINFRMDPGWFDLTFKPTDAPEPVVLMKAGQLLTDDVQWKSDGKMFAGRIQKLDGPTLQISIKDLQPSDSGGFKLIDLKGNLAIVVKLNVVEKWDPPYIMYVGVAVAILLVVVFCCCWVKRCRERTARKKDFVRQTEAAPIVYYLQDTAHPSNSAHRSSSHAPAYTFPLYPKEPGSTYHQTLVVASTASHGPASAASLGWDALRYDDAGPQFELKGMTIPSTPPPPYCDVYTSDKLNFL